MKYTGMPSGMWMLYKKSFRNHLVSDLGFTDDAANRITKQAKPKYRGGYETITKSLRVVSRRLFNNVILQ